ncbi:MAG: class I SAM-dependent methyltransferase [Planctomycetes bacterium]|nr:class I SAM-dependent methyltransferase [Planctomycetota bacterium]
MEWFKRFYAEDYFLYRYEPRLDELPIKEVEFLLEHGRLDFSGPHRPRVFDICCGVGRHARPLAARGCEVIGVDLANKSVQAAVELAGAEGLADRCKFYLGDIRTFETPRDCDLAINIFTSFGYFESDAADAVIMAKAGQSLRPGGRFILDVINREAAIADFKLREKRGRRGNYVIQQSRLDLENGRMIAHWTFVRGKCRSEHTVNIRLYALHELIRMAAGCGLKFVQAFGDFDGRPFDPKTPRCIFIAEKPLPANAESKAPDGVPDNRQVL